MKSSTDLTPEELKAGQTIAFFLQNVVRLRKLKESCFAQGGITNKRCEEIAALGMPKSEFLKQAYGIKMSKRGKETQGNPNTPGESMVLSHMQSPEYMRDAHVSVEGLMGKVKEALKRNILFSKALETSDTDSKASSMVLATHQIFEFMAFNLRQTEKINRDNIEEMRQKKSLFLAELAEKIDTIIFDEKETSRKLTSKYIDLVNQLEGYPFSFFSFSIRRQMRGLTEDIDSLTDLKSLKPIFLAAIEKEINETIQHTEDNLEQHTYKEILELNCLRDDLNELGLCPIHLPARAGLVKSFITTTGGTPSFYALLNTYLQLSESQQGRSSESFTKAESLIPMDIAKGIDLEQLFSNLARLEFKYDWHSQPHFLLIDCAKTLVQGIVKSIPSEVLVKDPSGLTQQCLAMINTVVMLMYTYRDNFERLNQLYDILIEELSTLLMYHGNLHNYNYRKELTHIYEERCSVLRKSADIKQDHFLCASGMSALATAITSLDALSKKPVSVYTTTGVYFESSMLASSLNLVESKKPTKNIVSILNSSSPPEGPSVEEIIQMVKSQVLNLSKKEDFVNLILDITIELDTPEKNKLNSLLEGLKTELELGQVNIMLCKSLQKYSLLGTSKVMAGDICIINNQDEKFTPLCNSIYKSTKALHQEILPEYPVLMHLLVHGHRFEKKFATYAHSNSQLIRQIIKPILLATPQTENSPFVIIPQASIHCGHRKIPFKQILDDVLHIDYRDSFAFLRPSYLNIDSDKTFRINPGMERPQKIFEDYYWLSLIQPETELEWNFDPEFLHVHLCDLLKIPKSESVNVALIKKQLETCLNHPSSMDDPYLNNKLCSMIYHLSLLDDLTRNYFLKTFQPTMNELLAIAANSELKGVTPGLYGNIKRKYFNQELKARASMSAFTLSEKEFIKEMLHWCEPEKALHMIGQHYVNLDVVQKMVTFIHTNNQISPKSWLMQAASFLRSKPAVAQFFLQCFVEQWNKTNPVLKKEYYSFLAKELKSFTESKVADTLWPSIQEITKEVSKIPKVGDYQVK